MRIKLVVASGLLASLSCFAQVVTTGGYATSAGQANSGGAPSAANAPLLATPDAALPGSGPAFGTPLSNSSTNDPRSTNGPSVYNPNGINFAEENIGTAAATQAQLGTAGNGTASANAQPFEFGVQQIGLTAASAPAGTSLGEIARELKAHRRAAIKVLNNDSVARLNSASTGMGSLQPQAASTVAGTATSPSNATAPAPAATTLVAQNEPPALPQSDNGDTAAQQSTPQPSSTAAQQRHAVPQSSVADQSSSDQPSSNGNTQTAAAADTSPKSKDTAHLPQTATHLPLLLLLGGLGAAGGALYYIRR
ncbi:MAG: LPXTG cell wall anchor domain-containing protein [Acidobacteria bacterium]|nr:LPXTG cell wall anchor domain-containing protein [Acidobacteriota bacterium]MBV9147418.1 LPXTG cell wall anchor domain-containing protein [Acidobacteriota bacterium]MBV9436485.1 LPXTG cell wall anchor domain-containing protein [Acidobacteriota bacterium]